MAASRHLRFGETENSAIRSAVAENPRLGSNTKSLRLPLTVRSSSTSLIRPLVTFHSALSHAVIGIFISKNSTVTKVCHLALGGSGNYASPYTWLEITWILQSDYKKSTEYEHIPKYSIKQRSNSQNAQWEHYLKTGVECFIQQIKNNWITTVTFKTLHCNWIYQTWSSI